jgi:DNA-directed RNA polymerase specialized sigma24 family protein
MQRLITNGTETQGETVSDAVLARFEADQKSLGVFARASRENESGLAQSSAKTDSRSAGEAWLQMKTRLLKIALGITRNAEDAADCVNDAVTIGLEQAQAPNSWDSWYARIVRNAAITCIRKRRPMMPVDALDAETLLTFHALEFDALTPLLAKQLTLKCTTKREQELIKALIECDGMPEVAERIGVSLRNVWYLMAALRAKLGVVALKQESKAIRDARIRAASAVQRADVSVQRYGSRARLVAVVGRDRVPYADSWMENTLEMEVACESF